jgi:hypothetical protein
LLCINLDTRFFECFRDSEHKAAFFAVPAVSFWHIGSRAETIWHFGRGASPSRSDGQPRPASRHG